MKRQALVATFVALVIAVAVPAAMADSSVAITPANGSDYILPDGSVYQLNDDGTYSWIPNVATANAMGLDWTNLISVPYLDGTVGDPFPSVLGLSNASFNRTGSSSSTGGTSVTVTPANGYDYVLPNGQVYQDNLDGTCSWIPDVATGNAMHLDWNDLSPVDDISDLPCDVGTPFPHAD
jgi:hypothetical protein